MKSALLRFVLPGASALTLASILTVVDSRPALACGEDAYIGQICFVAGNYCPRNTAEARGQLATIAEYNALYSLVGTTYGGDGRTTFGLPDLRGRAPVQYGQGPGLTDYNWGQKAGQESVTLGVPLPRHDHQATFTPAGGGSGSPVASGNVTLPFSAPVNVAVTTSGELKIANGTVSGSNTVTSNAVLARGGAPANIYAASTTPADTNIGPSQTFSGTGTGTVSGNATGPVTLPVTGGGGSGGTVVVGATGIAGATMTVPTSSPIIALRACIVMNGIYPPRP